MPNLIHQTLKAPLRALLAASPIRRRAIFELRHHYYAELQNRIPLGHRLVCPLLFPDAWDSFAEIFVQGEYAAALDQIPLPTRWVDLGCHAGFFSLYLVWRRARAGQSDPGQALLVDADSRVRVPVETLLEENGLAQRAAFHHGLIASGSGHKPFCERTHMASAAANHGPINAQAKPVPVFAPDRIIAWFPPPYDLIKVDIEGGEYDFLQSYKAVWSQTRFLLLEWHGCQPGGGGRNQILTMSTERGFESLPLPAPQHPSPQAGLLLLRNRKSHAPA